MQYRIIPTTATLVFVLVFLLSACSSFAPLPTPSNTPKPTSTITTTPTATPVPTRTLRPTRTPDLAATQRYDEMYELVQELNESGYLTSTAGEYFELSDFEASMAMINYYEWYPTGRSATNFVFSAHFKWSTATKTPDVSGCGVVFALQPNDDHYAVFLDKSLLRFLRSSSGNNKRLGKTSGTDAYKFENPDEADFKLVVDGNHAYVFVNDNKVVVYSLAQNVIMKGRLAFALRSGTNKGYGTRCEMTNVRLWVME